jgi:HAD superfamily hydrolase (TIGR01509 family)
VADKGATIKAAFFDIGNVLLQFEVRTVVRKIAAIVGSHPLRVTKLMWSRNLIDGVERGEITPSELYAIFQEELKYECDFPEFVQIWCAHFSVDRKAVGLLKRVSRKVPTYLLSNTNRLHFQYIQANYAFPKYVRGAVLSHRLGLRKPEEAIYKAALKRARVSATEAFFVDDSSENVAAAKKLGIHAVRFRGARTLEKDLTQLGLL